MSYTVELGRCFVTDVCRRVKDLGDGRTLIYPGAVAADPAGNFLVVDRLGTFLFSPSGELLQDLSKELGQPNRIVFRDDILYTLYGNMNKFSYSYN